MDKRFFSSDFVWCIYITFPPGGGDEKTCFGKKFRQRKEKKREKREKRRIRGGKLEKRGKMGKDEKKSKKSPSAPTKLEKKDFSG